MSTYLSRSFARCNSSFLLTRGNALLQDVYRLKEDTFLVDARPGTPRICLQNDLTRVPINGADRFENKMGFQDVVSGGESLIKKRLLESLFTELVAGDSHAKERATAKFKSLLGSSSADVVPGEPRLLLPRKFRQSQVWMEMKKNIGVRGFLIDKVRGGYAVAIAGTIAFVPLRMRPRLLANDRFSIERTNPKKGNIVVY